MEGGLLSPLVASLAQWHLLDDPEGGLGSRLTEGLKVALREGDNLKRALGQVRVKQLEPCAFLFFPHVSSLLLAGSDGWLLTCCLFLIGEEFHGLCVRSQGVRFGKYRVRVRVPFRRLLGLPTEEMPSRSDETPSSVL